MAFKCDAESCFQFLSRCGLKIKNLHGIDNLLFENGPELNNLVEITGEPSTGKTLLTKQLLMKCLLPKEWGKFHIGGLNMGSIMIDTDHHFQLLKLVNLMQLYLVKCKPTINEVESEKETLSTQTVEKIIKDSFRKLIILKCYDNFQFEVTLNSLENVLNSNRHMSLLVLDSISAYYWQESVQGGVGKMDLYLKKALMLLKKCLRGYKLVIMYTKPSYFQSLKTVATNISSNQEDRININYKIQLQPLEEGRDSGLFCAQVSTESVVKSLLYRIGSEGITWVN